MKNMKVALRQRAEKLKKDQNRQVREQKIAALSDKQKLKRDAGIAKRKQIRETRLANEETQRKERLAALKVQREKDAAAEKKGMLKKQQDMAKQLKLQSQRPPAPAATARARQAEKVEPKRSLDLAPTLEELRKHVLEVAPMPSMDTLSCALQTTVIYADKDGLSAWGDASGEWAHPSGWMKLIEMVNQIYRVPGSEPDWCAEVSNGEYNVVLFGDGTFKGEAPHLPPIADRNGTPVPLGDIVYRVTRPDSDELDSGKGRFHRYKRLENLTKEVYYTLHGAVNGIAPECYAALLYPAVVMNTKSGPVQLYGSLYVMRRAKIDLGTLLDDHADKTADKIDVQSMQYVDALRRSGRRVAVRLMPLLFRQSRLGVLSFDAKPGNYVFGTDSKPYAIDFDAAMYSLQPTPGQFYWEANMLMNLTLLTAHVRCYRHPALADGWASAVRELMIELCTHSRGERWLYTARADSLRKFKELNMADPEARPKVLEMVATAYFVNSRTKAVTPFRVMGGTGAAPLMHQLVRYCLHGSIRRSDGAVDRALGNPTAHMTV